MNPVPIYCLFFLLTLPLLQTRQPVEELHPIPLLASAYETKEPTINYRLETEKLNEYFERRIYRNQQAPESWYELITGTGQDEDRIYAYFSFVPSSQIRFDASKKGGRWTKILMKYTLLAGPEAQVRAKAGGTDDLANLMRELMVKERSFYSGIDSPNTNEGIEVRGIHLQVQPYHVGQAVIIGCSSQQWEAIRRTAIHGQEHPLYSLFPK